MVLIFKITQNDYVFIYKNINVRSKLMAVELNKQETVKRIHASQRVKSKLFLNPISGADRKELQKWLRDTNKGLAFVVTILE